MKINRTKNAARNILFGIIQKIYQIILPFLIRTAMIYYMGVQYLGLNSLFTSILEVLNLAELGVGSAMVYSMYKPIAEDDKVTICALMRLYRTYYRIIGLVIAVIGIIISPFIPLLIKNDLPPELNIYTLYYLNLAATVITYWLFAYKNCLFQAYQRIDVISKVELITDTLKYGIQLYVIIFLKDYYLYVIVLLIIQILNNLSVAVLSNRMYPEYSPIGELDESTRKDINQRIRDLFTSKVGGVVLNSSDTIVISAFLGLSVLAVYQNYYYILTAVIGVISIIFRSCTAGIGNSVVVETEEKNYVDLRKFTLIITWISGICTCCFLCLYQPFMRIWVGEELMLQFSAVICFCIYFFVYEINRLLNLYKDAAGIWHKDRLRPLVTSLVNLMLNLIMVRFLGVYGVILSTVIATLCVGMPWLLHNLFTALFDSKLLAVYIRQLIYNSLIVFISCFVCYIVCENIKISGLLAIFVYGLICVLVPNIIYLIFYGKSQEFKDCLVIVKRVLNINSN